MKKTLAILASFALPVAGIQILGATSAEAGFGSLFRRVRKKLSTRAKRLSRLRRPKAPKRKQVRRAPHRSVFSRIRGLRSSWLRRAAKLRRPTPRPRRVVRRPASKRPPKAKAPATKPKPVVVVKDPDKKMKKEIAAKLNLKKAVNKALTKAEKKVHDPVWQAYFKKVLKAGGL